MDESTTTNNALDGFEVELPVEERFYREGDEFIVRVDESNVSWSPATRNPGKNYQKIERKYRCWRTKIVPRGYQNRTTSVSGPQDGGTNSKGQIPTLRVSI